MTDRDALIEALGVDDGLICGCAECEGWDDGMDRAATIARRGSGD